MPDRRKILILGGTGDARALATHLLELGHDVMTSIAGVTENPRLPPGRVRTGGFGGEEGLFQFLVDEQFDVLVDATHPFACIISANGHRAAERARIGYVRFERPAWEPQPGDRWKIVPALDIAVRSLAHEACALVTIGRKELGAFTGRGDVRVVARMIEPPEMELPANWRLILARPPFTVEQEIELMSAEGVSVVVTKNSGGRATAAKLEAARRLSVPVIMIDRPVKPPAPTAATVEAIAELVGG